MKRRFLDREENLSTTKQVDNMILTQSVDPVDEDVGPMLCDKRT